MGGASPSWGSVGVWLAWRRCWKGSALAKGPAVADVCKIGAGAGREGGEEAEQEGEGLGKQGVGRGVQGPVQQVGS